MAKGKTKKKKPEIVSSSYSKFRTRWRHIIVIDQRIRSEKAPNCQQLAAELEVSTKTIWRDIEFLRDIGAPIEYVARKRGYVYTEPSWKIPNIQMTEGELFALMIAENALKSYTGTIWHEKLKQVFDRIMLSLPERINIKPMELIPRFSFDSPGVSNVDPEILEKLGTAIRNNKTIRMAYITIKHGYERP